MDLGGKHTLEQIKEINERDLAEQRSWSYFFLAVDK